MQVQAVQRDVRLSAGLSSSAFSIQANAKMFSILADKLYSDKPLAVVREYACNCLDAHALTGQTRPFLVAAPSPLEPMLVFRDYGPGMSDHDVMNRFTSFGDSSKNDDPDQIGGFGLGCKSGFAYTDAFTVASFQAGEKRVYAAFRGSDGIPQMAHVETVETEEADGFEVRIPIKDSDFNRFIQVLQRVLQYFPIGSFQTFGFTVEPATWQTKTDTWALRTGTWSSSVVLMGPVAYPLDWSQVLGDGAEAPNAIMPIFKVGELDLLPSREGLSYDPVTVSRLKARYLEICAAMAEELFTQVKTLRRFEQVEFIQRCKNNKTWKMVTDHFGKDGFPGIDDKIDLPGSPNQIILSERSSSRRRRSRSTTPAKVDVEEQRDEFKLRHGDFNNSSRYFVIDDLADVPEHKKRTAARLRAKDSSGTFYVWDQLAGHTFADLDALKSLFDGWYYADYRCLLLSELDPPSTIKAKTQRAPAQLRVLFMEKARDYFPPSRWRGNPWYEYPQLVSAGVYLPLNNYDLEDPDLAAWTDYRWAKEQQVFGLSKKARRQIKGDEAFEQLDAWVKRQQAEALKDPEVVAEVRRRQLNMAISKDGFARKVMRALLYRHESGGSPLFPTLHTLVGDLLVTAPAEVQEKASSVMDFYERQGIEAKQSKKIEGLIEKISREAKKYPLLMLTIETDERHILSSRYDEYISLLNRRTK